MFLCVSDCRLCTMLDLVLLVFLLLYFIFVVVDVVNSSDYTIKQGKQKPGMYHA